MPLGGAVITSIMRTVQLGIVTSGLGWLAFSIAELLAAHSRLEEPDPELFKRPFDRVFDAIFAPVGRSAAVEARSPGQGAIAFQLSVGAVVILAAVIVYILSAGAIVGAALASQQALGIAFDPVAPFQVVIGFVTVAASGVMSYAEERANRLRAC